MRRSRAYAVHLAPDPNVGERTACGRVVQSGLALTGWPNLVTCVACRRTVRFQKEQVADEHC